MKKYPQRLVNVRVTDKHHVTNNEIVKAVIEQVEKEMEWKWTSTCSSIWNRATCSCHGGSANA